MAFPRVDADFAIWFKAFAQNLSGYASTLGLTAADVTAVQNDAAVFEYLVTNLMPNTKAFLQSCTAYKDLIKNGPIGATGGAIPVAPTLGTLPATVAPGIIPRLRQLIQRIKAAPNYTEAIGKSLDIIDSEGNSSDDETTAKPSLKGTAQPSSEVRVDFNKRSFDGVRIESRRGGSLQWELLGFDAYSPYTDSRPPLEAGKAEVREYRARYVKRDEPVGEWSDIISVSTTP